MPVYKFKNHKVTTALGVWIAPTATIIGQVHLQRDSSVWWGAVLRGDYDAIRIGTATNIQDNCVIHTDADYPVTIGNRVTVGHNAVVHGCTIEDNSLIGINSTILNGVKVGKNCLIGSNALITEGQEIPEGSLVLGTPGRIVRTLTVDEIAELNATSERYVRNATHFQQHLQSQSLN